MDYQTRQAIQTFDKPGHILTCDQVEANVPIDSEVSRHILVVSDYNKGFVSKYQNLLKDNFYDFCIIDSRYGNTDFSFFREICHCLIWRQSFGDLDTKFNWDWKIKYV